MKAALILCTVLVSTFANPNGFYHQEYNYQTSSAHYKNRELQHKNDDAGFYSKDGDFEGRLRPRVNAHSQHSEYVNPKLQNAYHNGVDRTSSFGQLHAQNRFIPGDQQFGPDMTGAFSMVAPVHNYGVNSNLRQVATRLETEIERELQRAVYEHSQRAAAYGRSISQEQIEADRRILEEELRRNVTLRLNEALREQYGSQGIQGGNSYSIIEGRLQPTANYNTQELADLTRQLEANLLKRLEQQVQTYYRVDTAVHSQRNTYRHVNNEYPGNLQQRQPVYQPYHQPLTVVQHQPMPDVQPQPMSVVHHQPMPVVQHQPMSVIQPQRISVGHIPDSITTVATRVQTELNEHLNKILEDVQRRYFTESGFQTHAGINYDSILAQLQEELRANITIHFDEEIKRAYGYSDYATTRYSVEDIQNLRRQIENNLVTRLNRDFLRQRDNFLQTYRVYEAPRPIPANQIQVFHPGNTVHYQEDVSSLQRQMREQLSRQLQQALMEQAYRQAHTYSTSNVNPQENYQATLDQLSAELNRNFTRQWELHNLQNQQSGMQSAQLANMRSQLQNDLMRQLQQGLQQSYSRYSSWSSSSRASSSSAANAGSFRPVRGFDPNLYRNHGTSGNALGEDCMMGDDPSVYQQSEVDDSDLTQQTQDLTQQTEDLTQQSQDDQDLTQQLEDLTQQSQDDQDLTQQVQTHDDLTQQTEDLTQQTQTHDDLLQQTQDDQDLTQQIQTHDDLTQQSEDSPQQSEDLSQQTEDLTQQTQNNDDSTDQRQSSGNLRQQTQHFLDRIRTHDQAYEQQDQKRQTDLNKPVEVFQTGPSVSQNQPPTVYQHARYEDLDQKIQDNQSQTQDDLTQQTQDDFESQTDGDLTQQVQQEDLSIPQQNVQTGPSVYRKPPTSLSSYEEVPQQISQDETNQNQLTYDNKIQQNQVGDLTQQVQLQENSGSVPNNRDQLTSPGSTHLPQGSQNNIDANARDFGTQITRQQVYNTPQAITQVQRYQVNQQTPTVYAQEPVSVQVNRAPLYSRPQQTQQTAVTWPTQSSFTLNQQPAHQVGSYYENRSPDDAQTGVRRRIQYYEQLSRQRTYNSKPAYQIYWLPTTYVSTQPNKPTSNYRGFQPQTQQAQQVDDSNLTQQTQDLVGQQVQDGQVQQPNTSPVQNGLTQQTQDPYGFAPLQIGNQRSHNTILTPIGQPSSSDLQQSQLIANQKQQNLNQLPANDDQLQQIEVNGNHQNLQQNQQTSEGFEPIQVADLTQQSYDPLAPVQNENQATQNIILPPSYEPGQPDPQQSQSQLQQAGNTRNYQNLQQDRQTGLGQQATSYGRNRIVLPPSEEPGQNDSNLSQQPQQELFQQQADILANQQDRDLTQQVQGVDVNPIEPQVASQKLFDNQPSQQSENLIRHEINPNQQHQQFTQTNQQELINARQESQNLIDLLKNQKRVNDERNGQNQYLSYTPAQPVPQQQQEQVAQYSDDVQQPIQSLEYHQKPVYADVDGRDVQVGTTRQQQLPNVEDSDDVQRPILPLQYQPKPVYANVDDREVQVGTTRQQLPSYAVTQEQNEANPETTRDIEPVEPQVANQIQEVKPLVPAEPIEIMETVPTKKPGFWSRVGTSIKNKLG